MSRVPPPPPPVPPEILDALAGGRLDPSAAARTAQGIEARRRDVQRIEDASGGLYKLTFQFPQTQPGEALKAVNFGVTYAEIPHISHSYHALPNQRLIPGKFPIVSGGVWNWKFSRQSSWGGKLVTGCTFVMVSMGASDLQVVHHFLLDGRAATNVPFDTGQ